MTTATTSRTYFLILSVLISSYSQADESIDPVLADILQYEINNRAFALQSVSGLALDNALTEQAPFWKAYVNLENYNRAIYAYLGDAYGLEVNSMLVKLKVLGADLAFFVAPDKMMDVMSQATSDYVEKLRVLPDIGRPEDRLLFEYVIEQEEAQALALGYAVKKDYLQGAEIINSFLAEQSIVLPE